MNAILLQSAALAQDAGATMVLLAGMLIDATKAVPAWSVLLGTPVLFGLSLPLVHAIRAHRLSLERTSRTSRARRTRLVRARRRAALNPVAPSPAVVARELVRQGLSAVEVSRRTRLSSDAVTLLRRTVAGGFNRQVRPGAAPLAARSAGSAVTDLSPAAA